MTPQVTTHSKHVYHTYVSVYIYILMHTHDIVGAPTDEGPHSSWPATSIPPFTCPTPATACCAQCGFGAKGHQLHTDLYGQNRCHVLFSNVGSWVMFTH